jgi:hypothetical protein
LSALVGAVLWPWLFIVAVLLALLLLSLNSRLVLFFHSKGGWWFAARALAWHYLYFLYSGLAFAIGMAKHLSHR